jgi:hypothetical protein
MFQPLGTRRQQLGSSALIQPDRPVSDLRRQHLKTDELQHAALDRRENGVDIAVEAAVEIGRQRPPVVSASIARLPLKAPLA